MSVQTYAATIAAEFRAVGIYRGHGEPVRESRGGAVIGPVCFWVNNTAGNPPLKFRQYLDAPDGLIYYLNDNDDETVLEALDRIAKGE